MNYLTRDEVAQKLRVSVRTVSTYVATGVLSPPARLGRKPLWPEDAIARDIERNRETRCDVPADFKRVSNAYAKRGRGRPRKV